MSKPTRKVGLVTAALLIVSAAMAGCGTDSDAAPTPRAALGGEQAASWCTRAAGGPAGASLKSSVTSTLGRIQAWRTAQARAGGFDEQIQARFAELASLAPTDPLGVCLFVHPRRPISMPPGANIVADGTRAFVTPDGIYVEDAIGPEARLLAEMNLIQ